MSEQNERDHRRFEEFHREVDERFNVLIKMMDEWIRSQRNQNGRP
jgi:RNase H-fold protein (predicted Holliday junction resolvase)